MKETKHVVIPFCHPFMLTLCDPSQSGKTWLIKQIIENSDVLILPAITKLLYNYMCTRVTISLSGNTRISQLRISANTSVR